MSNSISNFKLWLVVFISLILAVILPYFSAFPTQVLLWFCFIWVFIFAFLFPGIGLFIIIFTRPILDYFGSLDILRIADLSLNIASLFALASLVYVVRLLYYKSDIKFPPLTFIWISFLGIALLSCFNTFSLKISISEWLRLLSIFSIYICAYNIFTKDNYAQFLRVFTISALVPSFFALYQYITHTGITLPFEGIYNRIYGTFAHPNLFAYYLVLAIAISVFILISNKKRQVKNLVFVIPLILYFVMLALTYTRGAWLALIILFSVIGLIRFRVLLFTFAVITVLSFALIPNINSRVNDLLHPGPDSSIAWRVNLWDDSINYFKAKPIFGYGTGTSQKLILINRGEDKGSSDAHNDYLKIALENGIIGLVIYTTLLFSLVITLFRHYRYTDFSVIKTLSLILFAVSVSFVILSFADNIIRNTALQWAFWSLLGGFFAIAPPLKEKS